MTNLAIQQDLLSIENKSIYGGGAAKTHLNTFQCSEERKEFYFSSSLLCHLAFEKCMNLIIS